MNQVMWRRLLSSHRSLRCFSSSKTPPVIAVCREESSIWERRAPLNPGHVSKLVKEGFKVLVQPSTRRAYSMTEYKLNGAVLKEDISEADVIFGVKAIPPELIVPNKRYAFFSHTIKAQPENMNVLDALLVKVSAQYVLSNNQNLLYGFLFKFYFSECYPGSVFHGL